MYKAEYVDKPCWNYCVLCCEAFFDPKDGVEKVAIVSFASFVCGKLYLIEPRSNAVEEYTLPLDNGAWTIYNHQNDALIIGTSSTYGTILRFDFHTRTFSEPLSCGETYIWDFAADGNGYLYGGTYNKAKLIRYDLNHHKLDDLGPVDPAHPGNYYNSVVACYDGYILCDIGKDVPDTFAYRICDGVIKPAKEYGIETTAKAVKATTDPRAKGHYCFMSDGSVFAIEGQEYRFYEGDSSESIVRRIPGTPPATGVYALAYGDDGILYGASNFGLTMFTYNPKTRECYNSTHVDYTSGGQIYGIVYKNGLVYMTSYAGGRHIVYDPKKPWDSRGGVNPYLLECVSEDYIRPFGRSVMGPRGDIWTGWYAKYGMYGGALSKIETETETVTTYPVGENGVASVTADDTFVYYVTCGLACGLPERKNRFKVAAVDADGKEVRSAFLPDGSVPRSILVDGDLLYIGCVGVCRIYCKHTLEQLCEIATPNTSVTGMRRFGSKVIAFTSSKLAMSIDPETHETAIIAELPMNVYGMCIADDTFYFGCGAELWKLTEN